MIMIPSSIAYFTLGFATCLILVFIWAVYTVKKEEAKRKEIMETYIKMIADTDKKAKEENKDE